MQDRFWSVAVEADDEVQNRGAVGHVDLLGGVFRPDRLLIEVERAFLALFVLDERIGLQILHGDDLLGGQWVVP